MEIHIQLAGVRLGPYSEKQVRQYLAEGLVSSTDLAKHDGMKTWEAVSDVLANLPPPSPPPPPPSSELNPIAVSSPVSTPIPHLPPRKPEIVQAAETSTPAVSHVTQGVEETKKAAASLLERALAKKTAPSLKTTSGFRLTGMTMRPSVPAASTKLPEMKTVLPSEAKTVADTPSVPVIPPVSPTSRPTSPAPPITVKSARETKTALPLLVKALAKSSTASIAASSAASLPSLPVPSAPPVSPRSARETKTALPLVVKALAKSSVAPIAAAPVLPPPSLPPVSPANPQTTPEMNPVKAIIKEPPPPSFFVPKTTAPIPTISPSVLPEKAEEKASRTRELPPAPPPATKALAQIVQVLKAEPVLPSAPPAALPKETAPSGKTQISPDMLAPSAPVDASPRARKKITPASFKSMVIGVSGILVALAVLILLYLCSSYYSAFSLRKALNDGNRDRLEDAVDFPSVRDSLKKQVEAQLKPSAVQDAGNSSSSDSASSAVLSMIENSIDLYVTPQGISALVNKPDSLPKADQIPTVSPDTAATILLGLNSQPVKSQGLVSLTDFVIDLDVAKLHLHFYGLGWKLDSIELKSDLQLPSLPGSPPSPASSTSSASPAAPAAEASSSLTSPVIETYLNEGNTKFQKGDWAGAIADFTQVLAIDSKATVAYFNRGQARQSKGDLDAAIADYTQALALDPKLVSAYYSRGNVKMARNDLDGAIADYTQALALDPKLTAAYYNRGIAKTSKNDLDGAIVDYTQVLGLDPNQANAYSNRGFVRQSKGDLDGAITDYTQALAINPQISVAYYNRGLARQAQGNLDAAIIDFNQALDLDPKLAGAYYNRGNAKNSKHDLDGAIADYTQDLALDSKNALAYSYRGQARQSKGDLDGAFADYSDALAIDPKISSAYYYRALIKEQRDDPDGAIADSTQALDLDPKNAQACYNRGFAKLTKGNLDGANTDLRKFCELAPRDHYADHARLYLWLIAKAANSKIDADQELSDSLESDWNSPPDDFVSKIAAFLLDRVSEADFIASAASSDAKLDQGQHCEAWYFAGMKRLLAADKAGAVTAFHKCVATGQKDYCEYILAQAELQALEPDSKKG